MTVSVVASTQPSLEDKIRSISELAWKGYTQTQIAKMWNVSRQSVHQFSKRHQIAFVNQGAVVALSDSEDTLSWVRRYARQGLSKSEVAQVLEISLSTVEEMATRHAVVFAPCQNRQLVG